MYETWFSVAVIVFVLTALFVGNRVGAIMGTSFAMICFTLGVLDLYGVIAVGGK